MLILRRRWIIRAENAIGEYSAENDKQNEEDDDVNEEKEDDDENDDYQWLRDEDYS